MEGRERKEGRGERGEGKVGEEGKERIKILYQIEKYIIFMTFSLCVSTIGQPRNLPQLCLSFFIPTFTPCFQVLFGLLHRHLPTGFQVRVGKGGLVGLKDGWMN